VTDPAPPTYRIIHTRASARQVPDLLQAIFVAELISPSRCLWLVSPWISDIPVIDNRTNAFSALDPLWTRAQVPLNQVLTRLLELGTTVHVATRPDTRNRAFLDRIRRAAEPDGLPLRMHEQEELHEKGILGDRFYLSGSMNFTFNGISLNEEAVHFIVEPSTVAENRVIFLSRWGGELT
jgi:phosphatidylserine/phosphatidylglycerophosphate/cardiolipin synthase-like enzyme